MPWRNVNPMEQRILFLADYIKGGRTFKELCTLYGISRKTGYQLVARYEEEGVGALEERSRRPHHNPQRTPHVIRQAIIEMRTNCRIAPGPKKITAMLHRKHPEWELPSRTTIHNILRAEGLITSRRRKRNVPKAPKPFLSSRQPNDVWTVDFKGQFLMGNGLWCYPLTVMDDLSRYLLCCKGLEGTRHDNVRKEFELLFHKQGVPLRIRSDNGVPFASTAAAGLSKLSVWWIRLGILPERIERGKPQQNGRHERMHKTLKEAATRPPGNNALHQQGMFDAFRRQYNEERPHEALGQRTPAETYRPSDRAMPEKLPELEYPGYYRVAPVSTAGMIYMRNIRVYTSHVLVGERVGVEEVADGIWDVYFGQVRLGSFDERYADKNRFDYVSLKL